MARLLLLRSQEGTAERGPGGQERNVLLLVPSPKVGGKCACNGTFTQGNKVVADPQQTKEIVNLQVENEAGERRAKGNESERGKIEQSWISPT